MKTKKLILLLCLMVSFNVFSINNKNSKSYSDWKNSFSTSYFISNKAEEINMSNDALTDGCMIEYIGKRVYFQNFFWVTKMNDARHYDKSSKSIYVYLQTQKNLLEQIGQSIDRLAEFFQNNGYNAMVKTDISISKGFKEKNSMVVKQYDDLDLSYVYEFSAIPIKIKCQK